LKQIKLFTGSIRLVWASTPLWATVNVVLSIVRSVLPLALIFLIKYFIDTVTAIAGNNLLHPPGEAMLPVISVVIVFFLDEVTSEFSLYIKKKQSVKLESYMYGLLHEKSAGLDLINFENPAYFDILARASREATWRPGSVLNDLISIFRGILSLILMSGVLLTLNWWLVILLFAANIPGVWLRLHFAEILYNFQRSQTPEARKSAYFNWILTGDRPAREIRLFGLGNYFTGLFRKSFSKQKDEEIEIIAKRTWIETVSVLFKAASLFLVLCIVVQRAVTGALSLGQMALFILAFRQGMMYIGETFGSLASLYEDGLFIGDTFEFLSLKEEISVTGKEVKAAALDHDIEIRDLSFTYPGNSQPAIKNVSFRIKKGEIVALVGNNGSGKSTLVRLLSRLYDPSSGSVIYDGTDIRSIDPAEYRKHFSVVFQDFMLYNLSAGENIRLGDFSAPPSSIRIKTAAAVTGVDTLISLLPEGYDTQIGNLFNESRELSWGEWQKIAISRALYRDASVLVLDEPSSALDAATEYEIFSNLREIVKGKTAILISHRFTSVRMADRILVLDKGEVAESGTHEELMKRQGLYYSMYSKQISLKANDG